MAQYFSLNRIMEACDHLADFPSDWAIVSLVFAVNGVNQRDFTNVNAAGKPGTTRFIKRHFNGRLMGLPDPDVGDNTLRPKFSDIKNSIRDGDYVSHQKVKLWSSGFSSRGYREMNIKGFISKGTGPSEWKLNASFKDEFERELTGAFHFEELLVWLYAFSGVPDSVTSWDELYEDFQSTNLGAGNHFEADYTGRFHVGNGVPWPTDFEPSKPVDREYQEALIPSILLGIGSVLTTSTFDSLQFLNEFRRGLESVGIHYSEELVRRFLASLMTKKFLILTGLAGSGKTKLAQSFAKWVCGDDSQFRVVPVGPDWTNNENILGYPDALDINRYVIPDALSVILNAYENYVHEDVETVPYFLILDEMNLSHVERYFADILSAIESGEDIHLHSDELASGGATTRSGVPNDIKLPPNLFIIGTVNVDETTYMFSPKVLDRANVIEFRIEREELDNYLANPMEIHLDSLSGKGNGMASVFLATAMSESSLDSDNSQKRSIELLLAFDLLSEFGIEFGFRTAKEISRFIGFHKQFSTPADWDFSNAMDAQVIQKLLPKLHGSRKSIEPVLWALAMLCYHERKWHSEASSSGDVVISLKNRDELLKQISRAQKLDLEVDPMKLTGEAYYSLGFKKIKRMLRTLSTNGFVSFAEA